MGGMRVVQPFTCYVSYITRNECEVEVERNRRMIGAPKPGDRLRSGDSARGRKAKGNESACREGVEAAHFISELIQKEVSGWSLAFLPN